MACYHPLIRVEDRSKRIRAKDGHYYFKATVISADKFELERTENTNYFKKQIIPCGKCIGCRLDYSREWANRGYLESLTSEGTWFVTLTYNEDMIKVPDWVEDPSGITYCNPGDWGGTLVPKDLELFLKNLRQIIQRNYKKAKRAWKKDKKMDKPRKPRPIRYMACGEYGSETERPHYHLIIFNLELPENDLYHPRLINKNVYYQSHLIERCWTKKDGSFRGICNICPASWNTIAYTARYITKKVNGAQKDVHYGEKGQMPEFFRVSRMPGIGEQYYREHWEEIYKNDSIVIHNREGAITTKPPKYYDELFQQEHPEEWKEIQRRRRLDGKMAELVKDSMTSLSRQERLEIEERSKDEKNLALVRHFEASH